MKFKLKALAAAAALALAAGAAQAQISGNVVKIGVLNDSRASTPTSAGTGSVHRREDGGRGLRRKEKGLKVEVVFADHQNKPDVGSQIARKWYRRRGRRRDRRRAELGRGARGEPDRAREGQGLHRLGRGDLRPHRRKCSPNTIHWTYDTWMLANGTGSAIVKTGGDTWFFLTADYAFGHALERDTEAVVIKAGGKVLGKVRHPLNTQDFSSFLLQAQASKAKIIGLANAGGDTINSIKQAAEFGIVKGGQNLAGLLVFLTDVHGLGLDKAQGLILTKTFYWDLNDQTRAWSKRFAAANGGKYPTMVQAGVYSGVLHYLKAVEALKSDDGTKVVAKMKELPTDDPLFGKGTIRADGRKIHPAYLVEVKKPAESKGPYDYYKIRATIPADAGVPPDDRG